MSILKSARKAAFKEQQEHNNTARQRAYSTAKNEANTKPANKDKETTTEKKTSSILESARRAVEKERQSRANNSSAPNPSKSTNKLIDFNTEAKNAYTSVKNKVNTKYTTTSKLTEKERKARISDIESEIRDLNTKLTGIGRAKAYGRADALNKMSEDTQKRISELSAELKTLKRTGTFTAAELKQFEIEDAKKEKAKYGVINPTARVAPSGAEAFKEKASNIYKAQQKIDTLEREKELYEDISKFGDVVNKDSFGGQFRANYRSNDLSREADKAMSEYINNPTEENKQIAYAYDAFEKAYKKNNEKALDDENVKASWLTKSAAGYLPQFRDTIVPEVVGGAVGGLIGGNVGSSAGAGIASYAQSYDVMRGSVYRALLAEGVDAEIALKAAEDEALIGSLIESGETALSWLLTGGSKAVSAISTAAQKSVAKGSTNAATGFIAKMAGKATDRAARKAVKSVSRPLWKKGVRVAVGIVGNALTEYGEEFTQGAVSMANREKALSTIDKELGQYGYGNIDLYRRPIYRNADGSISTVDSVTYTIDGKYVVLPTIVRDENGKAKRLNTDEEILAHYGETGEFLGEFDTLEEANAYANKLHSAQAYHYSKGNYITDDDSLWSGSKKVMFNAVTGNNAEAFDELHTQGKEGFKIGLMFGGGQTIVNNVISNYANAKTVKKQNEILEFIQNDEETLDVLIEQGKESGVGSVSAKIAEEVEQARKKGELTKEKVKELVVATTEYQMAEDRVAEDNTLEQAAKDFTDARKRAGVSEYEKSEFQVANEKANEAAFEAGRQNIPREKVNLTTLDQEEAYNRGRIEYIKNMPKATTKSTGKTTDRAKTVLGGGEKSIGVANGQAYVTNGKDILPSPTNRSVFIPVDNVEVAKTELGATESIKTSENIGRILASDFTPVSENFVDGTLENVGEVRVFTDENGREIALEKNVAEYFEGYNLEATFRGGKPYAIKATDNNGNVKGVAMAVWTDKSGQEYEITDIKDTNTIQTENTVKMAKNTVRDDIVNSRKRQTFTLGELNEISEADETLDVQEVRDVTGYGEKGAELVTKYANYEGVSLDKVLSEVEDAYFKGFENPNKPMGKFETKAQEQAYKAGQQDRRTQNSTARENAKKATIYKGAFTENEYTRNFTKAEKTMISIVAKALKMDISVVDKIIANEFTGQEANAEHQNGKMRISSTAEQIAQKVVYKLVMHESGHRLKQLAPDEFGVLMDALYKRSKRENAKSGRYKHAGFDNVKTDYENADLAMSNESMDTLDYFEEFAVRELETIFSSAREFNKWYAEISGNKQVKSAWDKFVDFILDAIDSIKRKLQLATMSKDERAKANKSLAELDRIKGLLANTYKAAENAVAEKNGTVVDAKGNVVAQINEDGTASFSLKTYDDSGRAELKRWLDRNVKNKKLTEAEAKDISEQLEYYYDICKEYEDKYAPFSVWSKAEVVKGLDGKPLMSVVKANGEYKMNLDFSLVCKKRRPLDALYRAMIDDGIMDNIGQLSEVEVARINEIIRKNGFETACTLCFVDSKRYRQYAVADSFVSKYNELVKMLAPEGAKIDRFDFSGKRPASADGLHTMSDAELKAGINKLNKVIKEHGETTVVGKIAKHLKASAKDRKLVMVSDFMDSEGFVRVKKANPNVFKLYNSSKGSGGPKATLPDVQYLGEILKRANFTPKKAYAVGGVRVQSFSDYIPRLVFDYLQMTADLTAKRLPAHAYSKEDIFVMQFGKTGIKINMSLVPAVAKDGIAPGLDKNGNYVWVDGHTFASDFHDKGSGQRGFELAVKIQNTEGYAQNCGTIAVGVSDEHIIKMLKDNDIRMVIPYHKSSLNHFVAKMGNIDQYKDYTNVQNTRDKATGKKIEGKDFNFNEAFHRLGDAKAATNEYLAWCDKNNYLPKFDTFAYHEDAQVRENYYKVLIDFAAYDSDGNPIPQRAVTMNFPTENDAFGSMKSLIEKGLEADAILEGRKANDIPKILKEVKATLGVKTEGKKYSLKETDQTYLDAVKNGDMETAQRMVDEAAKKAGYNSPKLYHGTQAFGFTKIKTSGVEEGADWSPFFATNKEDISATYVPYGNVREISSSMDDDATSEARENAIEERRENISDLVGEFRRLIDTYFSEWVFGQTDNSYLEGLVEKANPVSGEGDGVYDVLDGIVYECFYDYRDNFEEYEDYTDWSESSPEAQKIFDKITEIEGEKSALHHLEQGEELGGIYKLYANLDNMYVVDGKGAAWNKLRPEGLPKLERGAYKDVPYRTRDVAKWARENGFDGVVFKNIKDNGAYGRTPTGDVYAFFNPESQVKSADPVTYDDNGNIIPPSERFNTKKDDVRYSLKGGLSDTEIRKAIADKNLSKYVEKGTITTEKYNELIEKYGVIPSGERPHRDIQVPRKSGKKKNVSQTVRTILEAEATPDEAVPTIEKMVEDGIFSYDVYTDKEAIENGEDYIKEHGWEQSLVDWFEAVNDGEVSKDITTTGWILYNHAANSGDAKTAIMILDAMVRCQRSAAQALQATRILKKLSPEGQLYGVQKSVEAFQKELVKRYGKKAPGLEINEELAKKFLTAETEEKRLEAEIEIYKDIGRQMPSNWMDKWNAWRYIAMLTNPRTHIRNILGNAFFAPVVGVKNLTATAIESAVYRVSGKKMLRGKALVWGSKADRALLKAAWKDYANVADIVSNGGKYNDSAMGNQHIQEGRRIFKGILMPVEWVRRGNSKLLEWEDMWFSKPHYAYALAQYCKANNISPEQIGRGKAIAPAREYAIKEAQKATYKDTNAFSQMVSETGRHGKRNWATNAKRTLIEGVLPFRKTPANILARGVEYSPLGFIKGLSYDLYQVSKGKMSATDAIDNISAGLTGTGLLSLGIFLAAQGLIRGHGGEDKDEKEFKELMGHQDYSLELPNGQSVTLDWLAPESLPFFTGVALYELKNGDKKDLTLADLQTAISGISDPMLEMSFLQGLNDALESIGYAKTNETKAIPTLISTIITSYISQGIPTLFGQIERTSEEERMTTYTDKNGIVNSDTQYALGKASAKIPFWDYSQIPYIDAWGRKEASGTALKRGLNNFLNPAYTSKIETSNMEKELLRLYESTGEGSVFPSRADKYFVVDGVRKDLTADEYVRYATLKGEKSYKAVNDLVNSKAYRELSDGEKAKAIEKAYDYANQKAKDAISNYKPDSWVSKADEFGSNVGNYLTFKTELASTKESKGDKFSKQDVVAIALDMAQNDSEIWKMYLSEYDAEKDIAIKNAGIGGEEYMNVIQNVDKYDKPNKNGKLGTYTNDEIKTAIEMTDGLTKRERAVLWQEMTGSTSTKNNPWRSYLP